MHTDIVSPFGSAIAMLVAIGWLLLPMAFIVTLIVSMLAKAAQQNRLKFIGTYEFNEALRAKFANYHNFLEPNQQELVFTALKDYFYICHRAGKAMVSMPSQVVNDAWHQFILFTKDYDNFCHKAFGRFLHHTPAEAMETKTQAQVGIKRAWRFACQKEGINPNRPDRLPLIFAIDSMLEIENGFTYKLDCLADNRNNYCATHISCISGCGGGCGTSGCSGCGCSGGCSSGCGGRCGGC